MSGSLHRLDRLANRPLLVPAIVSLMALFLSIAWTFLKGVPLPSIHDEFCYLLQADTFAHGRLTNPPHPMWQHFETFHVLQQPTYQAKYQPAQGMILALGQLLTGLPIVGAWLAVAAACAATSWMLQGFLPPRWALLGSLLTLTHPLILWWGQNYWGGSAALIGAALLVGAVVRLLDADVYRRRSGRIYSFVLGMGLVILALSRPFEGIVLALAVGVMFIKSKGAGRPPLVPASIVLLLGMAFIGYYNFRVTGNPLRLPYQEYESQYEISTPFLWLSPHSPPVYRHAQLRQWFVENQYEVNRRRQQTFSGFLRELRDVKRKTLAELLASPWLGILLLMTPLLVRDRIVRWALFICIVGLIALCSEILIWPHYAAPFLPLLILLLMRELYLIWQWRTVGKLLVTASIGFWLAGSVRTITAKIFTTPGFSARREELLNELMSQTGKQLVIVKYLPGHLVDNEWVYNDADIDSSPVVWARDMGNAANHELLTYFKDRHPWLLTDQGDSLRLTSYSSD